MRVRLCTLQTPHDSAEIDMYRCRVVCVSIGVPVHVMLC